MLGTNRGEAATIFCSASQRTAAISPEVAAGVQPVCFLETHEEKCSMPIWRHPTIQLPSFDGTGLIGASLRYRRAQIVVPLAEGSVAAAGLQEISRYDLHNPPGFVAQKIAVLLVSYVFVNMWGTSLFSASDAVYTRPFRGPMVHAPCQCPSIPRAPECRAFVAPKCGMRAGYAI